MVEEAQDESSQSDQESDGASGSSDSATEAAKTTEEGVSPADAAGPEETAEPKKSGLNIHLILYPVLLILVAAAAILATIFFSDKDQTEASDNSDQLGSESTPYQISAESRPILVENITFQTKSSGNQEGTSRIWYWRTRFREVILPNRSRFWSKYSRGNCFFYNWANFS